MLHDDKRHAAIRRHMAEKLLYRFQPAGRSADADNAKILFPWRGRLLC